MPAMARINDVGGLQGFGPVDVAEDAEPFQADWEARVFALVSVLVGKGVFTVDEFHDAIERIPARDYLAASYYERWLEAARTLLADKGVVAPSDLP